MPEFKVGDFLEINKSKQPIANSGKVAGFLNDISPQFRVTRPPGSKSLGKMRCIRPSIAVDKEGVPFYQWRADSFEWSLRHDGGFMDEFELITTKELEAKRDRVHSIIEMALEHAESRSMTKLESARLIYSTLFEKLKMEIPND